MVVDMEEDTETQWKDAISEPRSELSQVTLILDT